jgi:hypothetical protein
VPNRKYNVIGVLILAGVILVLAILLGLVSVPKAHAQGSGGTLVPSVSDSNIELIAGRPSNNQHWSFYVSVYDGNSFVQCQQSQYKGTKIGRLVLKKNKKALVVRLTAGEVITQIRRDYMTSDFLTTFGKTDQIWPVSRLIPVHRSVDFEGQRIPVKLFSTGVFIYDSKPLDGCGPGAETYPPMK